MCNITKFTTFYQLSCWWNFWPSSTTLTFDLSCPNQLPAWVWEESTNTTIILRLLGTWSRGASVRFLFNWGTADFCTFCWTTRPRSRRFTNSKIKIYDLGHKLGPIEKKMVKNIPDAWTDQLESRIAFVCTDRTELIFIRTFSFTMVNIFHLTTSNFNTLWLFAFLCFYTSGRTSGLTSG